MITRMKHGVRGRYEKATTKHRGEQRVKQRAETIREKLQGRVEVGPLKQPGQTLRAKLLG
jgi:ATP-dependent helicase IRC3